jgi:hypothetical protein
LESKGKYSHVFNPFLKEANQITVVQLAAVIVIRYSHGILNKLKAERWRA